MATSAPEELTFQVGLVVGAGGAPVVMIVPTWCGAPEEGEARLAPFLRLGTLLANTVAAMPYTTALTIFDPYLVHGQRELMETCWLPALASSSIDAFIRAMETSVSPGCALFTHEFKGAASRVPANATAFGLRRDHVLVEILATFADGPDRLAEQRHRQWARATRDSFNAMALPGGYPNLLTGDNSGRVARSYGPNAERLIKAKRRYDPDNVFAPPFRCRSQLVGPARMTRWSTRQNEGRKTGVQNWGGRSGRAARWATEKLLRALEQSPNGKPGRSEV